MKRPFIFAAPTTLYHPIEGERVFTTGEQDPGAAWFDNADCKTPEAPGQADAAKQLAVVLQDMERLERATEHRTHDLAAATQAREAAEAKVAGLEQAIVAAERERDEAMEGWRGAIKAQEQAAEYARTLEGRIAKFDADGDGAPGGSASSAEKDELIGQLETLGFKPDKRKSVASLRAELDAATAPE